MGKDSLSLSEIRRDWGEKRLLNVLGKRTPSFTLFIMASSKDRQSETATNYNY